MSRASSALNENRGGGPSDESTLCIPTDPASPRQMRSVAIWASVWRPQYRVVYHEWDSRGTIRPRPGDVLLRDTRIPARGTIFRRSAKERGGREY